MKQPIPLCARVMCVFVGSAPVRQLSWAARRRTFERRCARRRRDDHERIDGIKRSVVSKTSAVFLPMEPGTYTVRATLQGFKTVERPGIRIGTQQFLLVDLMLEVGAISESVTVTANRPSSTQPMRREGRRPRQQDARDPAPGRNAFMIGVAVPTVIASGDPTASRIRPTRRRCRSAAARPWHNYLLDGVPIGDLRNRVGEPDDRSDRRGQGAGPHLRRRDGRTAAASSM
jgi:hypothetical protein